MLALKSEVTIFYSNYLAQLSAVVQFAADVAFPEKATYTDSYVIIVVKILDHKPVQYFEGIKILNKNRSNVIWHS